jgi:hypothetical protein
MAVGRCQKCGPRKALVKDYAHRHDVAKTERPAFCGRNSCMNPAVIWLSDKEQERYHSGERIFTCRRLKGVVLA